MCLAHTNQRKGISRTGMSMCKLQITIIDIVAKKASPTFSVVNFVSILLSLALSSLLILIGCTQEPDDSKMITVSVADIQPYEEKVWGAVTFENRQNRWGRDPRKKTWGTDAYVVNTPPVINEDVLTLNVSYSGGCKAHNFTLVVTSGVFRESNPAELQAIIAHNANGDTCEAYPTEMYHFDVSPLKAHYQKIYQTQAGTLRLRIKGIPELVVYTF